MNRLGTAQSSGARNPKRGSKADSLSLTLYTPRQAAEVLGMSYSSVKHYIYLGKIKSVKTPYGHHRIQASEIDRLLPHKIITASAEGRRRLSRELSGRNQLFGRVTDIKVSGLAAQVTLSVGKQLITSILSTDSLRELRLKKGQMVIAAIKSTEVMIICLRKAAREARIAD